MFRGQIRQSSEGVALGDERSPPSSSSHNHVHQCAHHRPTFGSATSFRSYPLRSAALILLSLCLSLFSFLSSSSSSSSPFYMSSSFNFHQHPYHAFRTSMPSSSSSSSLPSLSSLFSAVIVPAEAYIGRRRVSTTSITSLKNKISDEESLPPFQARPFDGGLFQWGLVEEDGDIYLHGNFSYNGDYYAAVGLDSPKRMQGPLIVCYVNSTVQLDSYATCLDYHGGNYEMQRAPSYTDMMEASVTPTGGVFLSFRRLLQRNNETSVDMSNFTLDDPLLDAEPKAEGQIVYDVNNPVSVLDSSLRVIFAKGKFVDNARRPKQHEAEDVKVLTINWRTGVVSQLSSSRHAYVLGAAGGVLVIMLLGGFIIHRFPTVLPTWSRFVGMALITVVFLVFCVGYSLANYLDYKDTVTSKAHVRALGDGAAFAFVCMMICVSRKLVMETCFGVSPERAVVYHGICCGVFFIVATAHAIGMLYFYGLTWSVRWRDKDHVSKLPGIIGYLLCVPVIVFGMLRNNGSMLWKLYKFSHMLHVPIVFFLCCHYQKLVYGLIAPAVLIVLDIILERFAMPFEEEADVIAVVDVPSQCTILRVYTVRHVQPGQWFRVQLPSISRDYHPLFVAVPLFFDNDDPFIEFIIKNTCDVSDRSWSREKDRGAIENKKKSGKGSSGGSSGSSSSVGGGVLPLRDSSWTSRLFHAVLANKKPIETVRLRGPCGSPIVSATYAENIFFVAGGVGIAPILSQITALTCGFNAHSIEVGRQHVVCLVWVIPNAALLNIYGHMLAQSKLYLKLINRQMAVSFKVYITDSRLDPVTGQPTAIILPPEDLLELCVVRGRRPDVGQDVHYLQQLIDTNASWSKLDDGTIEASSDRCAAYMCGPDMLLASVGDVINQRNEEARAVNKARNCEKQRAATEYVVGTESFTL